MGNTASQDIPSSSYQEQHRSSPNPNPNPNSSNHELTGGNTLSPSSSNSATVHPLLNPSDLRSKTSTPTTGMVQNDQDTIPQSNFSSNAAAAASSQDITMSGTGASKVNLTSQPSAMNIDTVPLQEPQHQQQSQQHEDERVNPPRRRSTLILTDESEFEKLKMNKLDVNDNSQSNESNESGQIDDRSEQDSLENNATVPVEINWFQGGENVFITGSFTGWRKMIKLVKEHENKFSIKLRLPYGTHRFRFIVDNELRFSDYLPTATDQMGNFVNYLEIQSPESSQIQTDEQQQQPSKKKDSNLGLTNDDDDMGNGYSRFHEERPSRPHLDYIRDIPAIFTDPSAMEQYYLTLDNNQGQNQNQSWLTPPHLPPHLESVILNNYSAADKSNSSGALPIPNHVVLNHLATTSIKHNTLAVASVVRYKRKYVTQVLYAPLQ